MFNLIIGALLIFLARVIDVSMGTIARTTRGGYFKEKKGK